MRKLLREKWNFQLFIIAVIFVIFIPLGGLQPFILYALILSGLVIVSVSFFVVVRKIAKPVENEYPKPSIIKIILSIVTHVTAFGFYVLAFIAYPEFWLNNHYLETAIVSLINIAFIAAFILEKRKWIFKLPDKIMITAYGTGCMIILIFVVLILFNVIPSCPVSCDDSNDCTLDLCSGDTGFMCDNQIILNCSGNGICELGEYPSEDCPDCDDQNPCTIDNYEFSIGCYYNLTYDCLGNKICELGEFPSEDCPDCDDNDSCTHDEYNFRTDRCDHKAMTPCKGNGLCELGEYGLSDCELCNSTSIIYYSKNECNYLPKLNSSGLNLLLSSLILKHVRVNDVVPYEISLDSVRYFDGYAKVKLSVNNISLTYLGVDNLQYTADGSKILILDINEENPSDVKVVIHFIPKSYQSAQVKDFNLIGVLTNNDTKIHQRVKDEKVHLLDGDEYSVKIIKPCNSCGAGEVPQTRLKINGHVSGDLKLGKSVLVDNYRFGIVGVHVSTEESYVEYYIRKVE
ncbi:hypothetical protein K9M79_05905 [Candidatus Woesearchaeota archaeon]|nr:hypothetical protein [Candidatus Woesearchaeota archaeon]